MLRPWNLFHKKKSKKGSRATDVKCSPPLKRKDEPGKSEVISGSLQKNKLETQKMETTESEGYVSEDEDVAKRLSTLPRGASLVSDEELAEMLQISQRKSGSNCNTENLIQKLQKQIEQEEILREYVSLEHMKPTDDCQIAAAAENREKNRYRDILPYDKTRVPLGEAEGYINASYIRVPVGKEEFFYISTQGPLPSTVSDFWQMVWENQSNVIAMITRETERGTSKCHRYWPEPPQDTLMDLSQFQLRMSNYQILDCFIIRVIEVTKKQTLEKRSVHHLQFTSWPDHGTPTSSKDLVKFVRYMRKIHQSGPIIAHCSAGIGRSGVLLCVDILLSYIEKDMPFDIKQIVTNLRQQRCGMIQTKEQYMFCYELALEVLKNIQITNS